MRESGFLLPTHQWVLLASLGYGYLHTYILPPGFKDLGSIFSFEEIGNDNFATPDGMRQWYEAVANSAQASLPKLSVQVSWNNGSLESRFHPVRWRKEGYGCAVVKVAQEATHQRDVLVRLFDGSFVVAETVLPAQGKVVHNTQRWMDHELELRVWLKAYQTGGHRLVSFSEVFQRVFASYAREDVEVVKSFESVINALGNLEFRWDLKILQSGDRWEEKLFKEIEEADSFQLFWSEYAKASKHVRKEWTYALKLNRDHFVRPVYWKVPMPNPPRQLSHLHFSRIMLTM